MQHTDDSTRITVRDPLDGLKNHPDLWALFERQPQAIQQAYLDWFHARTETRAAHRDCLEAFLGGYSAGWAGKRRRVA